MPTTNDLNTNSDSTLNVTLILVRSATWFSKDSGIMSNKVLVLRLVCVDEEVKGVTGLHCMYNFSRKLHHCMYNLDPYAVCWG